MKRFKTESSGEYLGKELQTWLKSRGTSHELATAYSPESNGRAERLNRTLLDMATSAMIAAPQKVPTALLADAIDYAKNIRNRLQTRSTKKEITSFEVVHGRKPNSSSTRVFGCKVSVQVPKQKCEEKFDACAKEGVFTGLEQDDTFSKFLAGSMAVAVSKDVSFDERLEKLLNKNKENEKYISFDISDMELDYLGTQDGSDEEEANIEAGVQGPAPTVDYTANAQNETSDEPLPNESENASLMHGSVDPVTYYHGKLQKRHSQPAKHLNGMGLM